MLLFLVSPLAAVADDCTRLARVDIESSEILSPRESRALTSAFLGRCIDGETTRELLAAISDDLIGRGYITSRPYLLAQDVSDGQIEIRLLAGTIEAVVDAASGVGNSRIDSAFLFSGEILNLRELESALEVMQRLPSVAASFEILPGTRPGSSVVRVDSSEQDRLRIALGASAQTELDDQLSLDLSFDNPFNINDQLELRVNDGETLEIYQANRGEEIGYSFALGDYVTELSRSDIEFEQRIQGSSGSLVSAGVAVTDTIRLDKTLRRDQRGRLALALALERKDSENFFEDELVDVSSYVTSQLRLEINHLWLQPWGQLSSYYRYHRGLDAFGARDDDYFRREDGAESEARLQFEKITLGANLVYLLPPPGWQIDLSLHLQYSDDLLYDSDKLNLGSPYTVRGYSSALSGSNAGYLRLDLIRLLRTSLDPFDSAAPLKTLALSAGLDYGEADCEIDNPDSCGEIYAAALGLLLGDANFSGSLSYGHPLKKIGDDIGDEDIYRLDLRWQL